jgi:hypothetical protein
MGGGEVTDQEMTQQVVDKMDSWAKKIAEAIFEKECIDIPPAVCCMAAVYFIKAQIQKSTVVTPAAILKILEGKLYEDIDVGDLPTICSKQHSN